MNKLNGFKFNNYLFITRPNWSNLKENLLDLSFIIENNEMTWDNRFNVTINNEGDIVRCNSLSSTCNNIEYYISMGENLKRIKNFCKDKGKELFMKAEKLSTESNKVYDRLYVQENAQLEKLKEECNYHSICDNYLQLNDTLKNLNKRKKLSRKENTLRTLGQEIEKVEKEIKEAKNKLDDYEVKANKINEEIKIMECKEKEINRDKLIELEKEYSQYL